jgi:hypothetical protein
MFLDTGDGPVESYCDLDYGDIRDMQEGMTNLTVTAHTPAGFCTGDPWSPTLDGILAWAFTKEKLGSDFGTNLELGPVLGLPLAVDVVGLGYWWYYCGLPEFELVDQHEKFVHRRFDAADGERFIDGTRKIQTAMGKHKNMRKPRIVNVTPKVTWKTKGHRDEILRLLEHIPAIGSGWSRGYGRVSHWTVEEGFDGEIRRPIPAEIAALAGIDGVRQVMALVPPTHLAANKTLCVITDQPWCRGW